MREITSLFVPRPPDASKPGINFIHAPKPGTRKPVRTGSAGRNRRPAAAAGLLWLFDLDNTLHDASEAIFPAIHINMNAFIAQVLGNEQKNQPAETTIPVDDASVDALRLLYWRRYGATLPGMVRHHAVRPEDFLREAHRFDDLPAMIRAESGLAKLLARLPGRKILLTNAPRNYAGEVMRHLGLQRHFVRHIAIESMHVHRQLRPKPSRQMLRKLLAREHTEARRCILVEDSAATLKAARAIGIRTVWITRYLSRLSGQAGMPANTKRPAYIDVKVQSLQQLPASLNRLLALANQRRT